MHVFQLEKHQQRPLLVPLKEREYEDLHRLAKCWLCWGINKGGQAAINQIRNLDGWYVLSKQLSLCELQHGKGRMLSQRWFKAYTVKSSTLINSFAFFTGNKNRASRYRIVWRAACRAKSSAAWTAGRLMYGMVLRTGCLKVLIPNKTALLMHIMSLTHLPPAPNSSVIHCKTLGPCSDCS